MKKILRNIASAICAAVIALTASVTSVSAKEEEFTLPSGLTMDKFEWQMSYYAERHNNQIDYEHPEEKMYYSSGAVAVFKGNEVLYTNYYGCTDWDNMVRVDENSVFEWGSITKTLTWVSIMQLKEQGKLNLDDDVRKLLPEGFFQHLSYDEPITVLDLMNHTAGWQETIYPLFQETESDIMPLKEALQTIEPAQAYHVGEVAAYSNYGAAVAGYLVECISGMSFEDYVHKNIFEPLGMEHTAIAPDHSDSQFVYNKHKEMNCYKRFMYTVRVPLGNYRGYCSAYPCGAAEGTIGDLMKYAQALSDKNAPLFKDKATQEEMYSPSLYYGESDVPLWAHGFIVGEYGVRAYGHGGATGNCRTNMMFDPESGVGVVAMVNEPEGNWLLDIPFTYALGELKPDTYGTSNGEKFDTSGYYLCQRSHPVGMGRLLRYLSAIKGGNLRKAENIGNGLYQITAESEFTDTVGKSARILGETKYSNGRNVIQMPTNDYVYESFYLVKLMLLAMYMLMGISGFYMLRISVKLKKISSPLMISGHIARLLSLILILTAFVIFNNHLGITKDTLTVIGVLQLVCLAVCGIAAVYALVQTIKTKGGARLLHILNVFSNGICVCAILFYEMYRFWNC